MHSKTIFALAVAAPLLLFIAEASAQGTLYPTEELGKNLFFDTNLSDPPGQACAACHGPEVGYTGPNAAINAAGTVYEGAVTGRFGNRKPPAAAYAGDSPILYHNGANWEGGMFWDGRATGWTLGDPLAEQALGPFLNPLEQNNASPQVVIDKVLVSNYSVLFLQVCTDSNTYYECIGRAIAAYERSVEVSQFTSKYDYWLRGQAKLTGQEQRGLELFNGKAKCANCHVAPLFTDFTYDNLGVPRNPLNPFYNEPEWNPAGAGWIDTGLGGFLKAAGYPATVYTAEWGKQKVPTLRNVDLRPTALHKSLRSQWLLQVSGRDRALLQHEGRSRRGMAAVRSGRQHQHSRNGESWTEPRGGTCHRRILEDPIRWLHAQEVAGKLHSRAIPFPKTLRAVTQGRPYFNWRSTSPAPGGRSHNSKFLSIG